MWRLGLGCALAACTGGCVNLRSISSGEVGCPADQITISDDSSEWSARTWVAECNGKRFFCSAFATGKSSGQVTCKEDQSSDKQVASDAPPTPQTRDTQLKPEQPGPVDVEPPASAAGFTFGATLSQTSAACTDAGHEWQALAADRYTCSATPTPIGLDTTSTLGFCAQKLCAVKLEINSTHGWMNAFGTLSDALTKKYGDPGSSSGGLALDCRTEPEFEVCVMDRGLKLSREWRWSTGERISLKLDAGQAAPRLGVVYAHPVAHTAVGDAL